MIIGTHDCSMREVRRTCYRGSVVPTRSLILGRFVEVLQRVDAGPDGAVREENLLPQLGQGAQPLVPTGRTVRSGCVSMVDGDEFCRATSSCCPPWRRNMSRHLSQLRITEHFVCDLIMSTASWSMNNLCIGIPHTYSPYNRCFRNRYPVRSRGVRYMIVKSRPTEIQKTFEGTSFTHV